MSSRSPGLTTTLTALITMMSPLALSSADLAQTGEGKKFTPLKIQPLPISGQALCPADLVGGQMSIGGIAGTVIPKNKLSVTGTQTLEVLGTQFQFSGEAGSVMVALQKGTPVRLNVLRDGVGELLPLIGKKSGQLAVPVVVAQNNGYTAHYRSGSVAVGRIKKEAVLFYDSNLDGKYTVADDAVSIGSGVVFASIGKYLATSEGLMTLGELKADGSGFQYEEATVETGRLDVSFVMPAAETHAVFTGPSDSQVVVAGGKALTTLPGQYRLSHGLVFDRKTGVSYAGIVTGKSEPITVAAGKEITKASFGGTFTGDIPVKVIPAAGNKPKQIVIEWPAIRDLRGTGGEYYVGYRIVGGAANVFIDGKQVGSAAPPC